MASKFAIACALGSLFGGEAIRHRSKAQRARGLQQLPSKPLDSAADEGWWAKDGELTYYPPADGKLTKSISDYYYAIGSPSALTAEHKLFRVGGTGDVHIFHNPQGHEISTPHVTQTRGNALTELRALKMGETLGRFPEFELPSDYQDPLDSSALAIERQAMSELTEERYTDALRELSNSSSARLTVTTRNTDDRASTQTVVEFLDREFAATGMTTCVQSFEAGWWTKMDVNNVIGFVQGTSEGTVTLGAHFDDLPRSGTAPGAEDNGSGTAAVLAALKAFMATGARPKKSIYFVAFGGEEQGLYGSARFAEELDRPGSTDSPIPEACRANATSDNIAFTMDMIGYRDPSFSEDSVLIETRSWSKDAVGNPLAMSNRVNNAGGLKLLYSSNPFGSDHMSFLNKNIPASLTIDNDGSTSRYSCYHRSCDTMDKIDTRFATETAKMNFGAVLRAAGIN